MSNETFAAFRKTHGDQLGKLAEEHFNKDLEDTDRETLKVAASKFSTHAQLGSLIGIGLGALLAFRVRSARMKVFNAFKAREKPVSVSFADGRTEPIPDITNLVKPTVWGDLAAYLFFTAGGLFIGGETGLITGSISAGRLITKDPASRERIEKAFQKFKADALRQEADKLDGGQSVFSKIM
ncbi:hypothetical protein FKW77_005680 [Venturia effusa]|uniref:Uncharacterized protein n=1 Tax=Venturia effusa TaxID=50376 RepID=A0A517L1F0_9PEZI|nr:hypothetical protein FKW77_005680 [Venturia effusa]